MSSLAPTIAIATTPVALQTLVPFCTATHTPLWIPEKLTPAAGPFQDIGLRIETYRGPLRSAIAAHWQTYDGWVFGLATGAVVRLIAPLLTDKATDPAVVVVDEAGQYAISLCGGHQGGADRLAEQVSQHLHGTAILTGSANGQRLPGIDVMGQPFGWRRGEGDWTGVSSTIARGEPVQVIQEAGSSLWRQGLPADHPFLFDEMTAAATAQVWISPRSRPAPSDLPAVQWHPRVLWVGIGCERGTAKALIQQGLEQVLQTHQLAAAAIAGVASLDLKADEPGLVQFCADRGWPLRCFSPETLSAIPVPNPSATVAAAVGTPSVAEAAAIAAARSPSEAGTLCVSKQVIRDPQQPGAVTLAIAQSAQEYTGRCGHLWLVGIGPGRLDQITPAARTAIAQADGVIGYGLYIDLIRPLLRPGQIVEARPITEEQQRAERAVALAQWGLSVAVVSSGDCGIYAMGGLVLAWLQAQGWDGQTPAVEIIPGISALQAAAARVGTPLMHDFCAISLSDLMTPWPVIEQRLRAAAEADFVVVLYNPKSQKRTEQIAIAQRILAQQRSPDTPVALVRAAYRPDERIILTTVADMLQHPIDMLTTVLIGNRSTYQYADRMITPRGYAVGEDNADPTTPSVPQSDQAAPGYSPPTGADFA